MKFPVSLQTQFLLRDWDALCGVYARVIDGDTSPEIVEEAERLIKQLNDMRREMATQMAWDERKRAHEIPLAEDPPHRAASGGPLPPVARDRPVLQPHPSPTRRSPHDGRGARHLCAVPGRDQDGRAAWVSE